MAAFQGASLRAIALPVRGVERRGVRTTRATRPTAARSTHRIRPTGLLMAAILTATMLALVYLTQTLASNATSLEIIDLGDKSQVLQGQLLNQRSKIETDANPDAIIRAAKRLGLVNLGDARVLEAP
ncbi:MAG: hypothetical protein ACC726_01720 [Chloroflexota bacterium]